MQKASMFPRLQRWSVAEVCLTPSVQKRLISFSSELRAHEPKVLWPGQVREVSRPAVELEALERGPGTDVRCETQRS